jgi:hypothetical protein
MSQEMAYITSSTDINNATVAKTGKSSLEIDSIMRCFPIAG